MNKLLVFLVISLVIISFSPSYANENTWGTQFPEGLITTANESYDLEQLESKKLIGLYFTASWCRGCQAFTPNLIPFRNTHKDVFEVVMVNFDHSKKDMMAYMTEHSMPWPAIDYGTSAIETLKKKYDVSEIPALIILSADGRVITKDGYLQVDIDAATCMTSWLKLAERKPITSKIK